MGAWRMRSEISGNRAAASAATRTLSSAPRRGSTCGQSQPPHASACGQDRSRRAGCASSSTSRVSASMIRARWRVGWTRSHSPGRPPRIIHVKPPAWASARPPPMIFLARSSVGSEGNGAVGFSHVPSSSLGRFSSKRISRSRSARALRCRASSVADEALTAVSIPVVDRLSLPVEEGLPTFVEHG